MSDSSYYFFSFNGVYNSIQANYDEVNLELRTLTYKEDRIIDKNALIEAKTLSKEILKLKEKLTLLVSLHQYFMELETREVDFILNEIDLKDLGLKKNRVNLGLFHIRDIGSESPNLSFTFGI